MRYALLAAIIAALALGMAGCAPRPPIYVGVPVPLFQQEVIDMTRAGATDEEIIREIVNTRTVYSLTVGDISKLKEAGVSEGVINYMLETPNRRVRVIERVRYVPDPFYGPWYDPWYDPWWYDPWYDPWYPRSRFHFGWRFYVH